jgi:3-oxoacyl-ACP reductase-like protein
MVEKVAAMDDELTEAREEIARFMSGDLGNIITHHELLRKKAEAEAKRLQDACYVWQSKVEKAEQENKRLLADMRQAHAWAVLCGTPTGMNLARFLEQALKERKDG